uniref:CBP80/20-dependent translation initiation factor n=1 Tax=Pygocentrus nattereri TaxID=42514 RepID=A0AAR2JGA4_PYGNA
MESSSVASASSEAGSTRSQEIEELERFIDSYVLEYQVQGLLSDKNENDPDGEKTQSNISQWTEDCSDKVDGSWSSSRGRGSSKPNGNRDGSFDILGTDIWAANTMDSHGGATWDLQPEKLDFSQFHRKQFRGTPKHLPHIDREGNVKHGGRGYQQGRGSHHGYSQNRRWHQHHKQQANSGQGSRNTKEAESVRGEEQEHGTERAKDGPAGENSKKEGGKVSLLQSSKERLRRRLKEKEDIPVAMVGPQRNRMDKLLEILNSMRSNSSGVEGQLTSFMEEAQNSADSEETLTEIVQTIYRKAVSDRSFAATAAKLCDRMALFMVEGTKFRSLLLNMLQKDFTRRDELQQTDVECWLGFITFLCEVFGTMRSSTGEPFRVLVCPIYTCLRELLESAEVKEDAVLCCSMELQSAGRLLEEQLPEMMTELLAAVRDKMLCPSESQLTRSLLMEVIELHAHHWSPLEALTTQYYNRTIQKLTA